MKRKTILTSILVTFVVLSMVLSTIPTVASDGDETSTRQLADILVVRDGTVAGANGETIYPILIALSAAGYSYKYVPTEDALPPKWNDPRLYPSIFWICGDEPRGGIMTLLWGELPTLRNAGKLVDYVQDGGNVLTTGSQIGFWGRQPRYVGTDYDDWVLHAYPGSGGLLKTTYTTDVITAAHDIFTTPNLMPTTFTYSYYDPVIGSISWPGYGNIPFLRTELTTINNGELVSEGVLKYYPGMDTVVYDGIQYGSYGRTVFVNRRICYQWDSTDKGDMLTPFIQNVAAWFKPPLTAKVSVEPETLKLSSNGKSVTVKIQEFRGQPGLEVNQVDPTSVKLNGIQCQDPTNYYFNSNGNFIIKADRLALEDYVNNAYGGGEGGVFNLEVTGKIIEGPSFTGSCTIKIMP